MSEDQIPLERPKARIWMVEFDLPEITMEFAALIPSQRLAVGMLMSAGSISTYTLSGDRTRLWVTVVAGSEDELRTIIGKFPILPHTRWRTSEVMFSEIAQAGILRMSMN